MERGKIPMKANAIRTVDVLENLRVSLSQEIEVLLNTGKDTQSLDRVKSLRKELGEVKDELQIAKNVAEAQVKDSLLSEAKEKELAAITAYENMISLVNQVLPILKQAEPLIARIAENNYKRSSFNSQIDTLKERWQNTYNETLQVKQPMVGIIHMVDAQAIQDYIARLEGLVGSPTMAKEALVSSD
jgi:hypothetical protein